MLLHATFTETHFAGSEALSFANDVGEQMHSGIQSVVISLRYAKSLDVTGVGVLVRMYSQLKVRNVEFSVEGLSEGVESRLAELGILKFVAASRPFTLADSVSVWAN